MTLAQCWNAGSMQSAQFVGEGDPDRVPGGVVDGDVDEQRLADGQDVGSADPKRAGAGGAAANRAAGQNALDFVQRGLRYSHPCSSRLRGRSRPALWRPRCQRRTP